MVESTALEMRHTRKGIAGSNPALSAIVPFNYLISLMFLSKFDCSLQSNRQDDLGLEGRQHRQESHVKGRPKLAVLPSAARCRWPGSLPKPTPLPVTARPTGEVGAGAGRLILRSLS